VEGAWNEDGKGESVWDRFTHNPSMIKAAATGDVACDTYHRYVADLRLMKALNIRSYRFSVSWPRVLPLGSGANNQKGLRNESNGARKHGKQRETHRRSNRSQQNSLQ